MASGLLMLLDDIATILDDISVLTKIAAKKTAGVLGDDLALNAQQVSGVDARRELPVVWAVAKGSIVNKMILVPAALALSAWTPHWVITALLVLGGLYLCYEGCEKIVHKFFHSKEDKSHNEELKAALVNPAADMVAIEKQKIKGAIRTDFILSAEIIVITLGTVTSETFVTQLLVLIVIALLMTVGVYGLVAGIVKLDDLGMRLVASSPADSPTFKTKLGSWILTTAPYLMKFLSVAGTVAMFLVGGGLLTHAAPAVHHAIEGATHSISEIPGFGVVLAGLSEMIINGLVGLVAGAIVVGIVAGVRRLLPQRDKSASHA